MWLGNENLSDLGLILSDLICSRDRTWRMLWFFNQAVPVTLLGADPVWLVPRRIWDLTSMNRLHTHTHLCLILATEHQLSVVRVAQRQWLKCDATTSRPLSNNTNRKWQCTASQTPRSFRICSVFNKDFLPLLLMSFWLDHTVTIYYLEDEEDGVQLLPLRLVTWTATNTQTHTPASSKVMYIATYTRAGP